MRTEIKDGLDSLPHPICTTCVIECWRSFPHLMHTMPHCMLVPFLIPCPPQAQDFIRSAPNPRRSSGICPPHFAPTRLLCLWCRCCPAGRLPPAGRLTWYVHPLAAKTPPCVAWHPHPFGWRAGITSAMCAEMTWSCRCVAAVGGALVDSRMQLVLLRT